MLRLQVRQRISTIVTHLIVVNLLANFSAVAEPESESWRSLETTNGCLTTRNALLAQISITRPTISNCVVTAGRWIDAWTGEVLSRPEQTDVEHVVPVQKALDSGGSAWDTSTRQRFFNDLDNLVVVSRRNEARPTGYGPDMWLPAEQRGRCLFARAWISVKTKWRLVVTDAENQVLSQVVSRCPVERRDHAHSPFDPISVDELF